MTRARSGVAVLQVWRERDPHRSTLSVIRQTGCRQHVDYPKKHRRSSAMLVRGGASRNQNLRCDMRRCNVAVSAVCMSRGNGEIGRRATIQAAARSVRAMRSRVAGISVRP